MTVTNALVIGSEVEECQSEYLQPHASLTTCYGYGEGFESSDSNR